MNQISADYPGHRNAWCQRHGSNPTRVAAEQEKTYVLPDPELFEELHVNTIDHWPGLGPMPSCTVPHLSYHCSSTAWLWYSASTRAPNCWAFRLARSHSRSCTSSPVAVVTCRE